MKKKILIGMVMFVGMASAVATTSFDRVNALREELKLHHVDGKKAEATQLATKLAAGVTNEPFIQGPLQEELAALDANVTTTSLDKAVGFVTGKKTELYCEGQGLVEMSGEHLDGSTSHIVLVRSNRVVAPGSFSLIEGGDWAYEFTDSYRRPSVSELFQVAGSANSYHVKEVRNKPNGKIDSGEYRASWTGGRMSSTSSSSGEFPEPLPNYMAIDFHKWGNDDLGYKIKFEPGFRDQVDQTERTLTKDILISSERTVGENLPTVEVTDSGGEKHEFKNCFPVKYNITMKRIVDRQLVVDGKVNKESIRNVIKRNRKLVRSCFDQAQEVDGSLRGSVTFAWEINDKGRVTDVRPVSRSLTGDGQLETREAMIECMANRIKVWKFPAAPAGQDVRVTNPFTLRE